MYVDPKLFANLLMLTAGTIVLVALYLFFEFHRVVRSRQLSAMQDLMRGKVVTLRSQSKQKQSQLENLALGLSKVITLGFQKLNIYRQIADSMRNKLKRAGVLHRNGLAYALTGKVLGAVMMPLLLHILLSPYDFYRSYFQFIWLGTAAVGFFIPEVYLYNRKSKRLKEINKFWGDALDIIVISVSSGQTFENATRRAAIEMSNMAPELAKELTITVTELSLLERREDAYRRLGDRVNNPLVRGFVFDVIQSELLGTPLGKALQANAMENRKQKEQEVEKKAAALGPKLTVPLIVFFFPILFVTIITPVFLQG